MNNRANDSAHERTILTDDYLSQCINELQNMITVCQSTMDGKNFSQACREANLDREKMKDFLSNRLMKLSKVQDKQSSYDGYKHFYLQVFGESVAERMKLPVDYKESVIHVLNNTGIPEEDSDIVQKRFGIGRYAEPSSTKEMADTTQDRKRIQAHIRETVVLCRKDARTNILREGIGRINEKSRIEQKMADDLGQTNAVKRNIADYSPESLREYLSGIPVRRLNLTQPAAVALKSAGVHSIYDALSMTDEDIEGLSGIHDVFKSEIKTSRSMYAANEFGISLSDMMDAMSKDDDFAKAVESIPEDGRAMEQ